MELHDFQVRFRVDHSQQKQENRKVGKAKGQHFGKQKSIDSLQTISFNVNMCMHIFIDVYKNQIKSFGVEI